MQKKNIFSLLIIFVISNFLISCATLIGGSKYHAKVLIPDHPNAKIEYNGQYMGAGEASFLVPRKEADDLTIIIKENGCEEERFEFTERTFRGWAFAGTVIGWTGFYTGIPLPWGVAVDGATGAWWKPDINEKGVSKQDYNNYTYRINYTGCKNK